MSAPLADRNLLFGILALQMDFINRVQLIAAMQAWVFDKSNPVGQILGEQKALTPDHHAWLEAGVEKHLAAHGNDAEKSLAAVSSVGGVRQQLAAIADADVQASLVHVATATLPHDIPVGTIDYVPGVSNSQGTRFRIVGSGDQYVIDDYGGALIGTNTIDLYKPSRLQMQRWGVRHVDIEVTHWGSEEESLKVLRPRKGARICRQMISSLESKTTEVASARSVR